MLLHYRYLTLILMFLVVLPWTGLVIISTSLTTNVSRWPAVTDAIVEYLLTN